ncbi:MAG: elongation factor G [Deltaproteobacteria bacterium]|nr:elongation factor G [Deltaproteobacteria bacterium]
MASKSKLSRTRNIGVIAHIDAGKTTVTERILFYTGKSYIHIIDTPGHVDFTMEVERSLRVLDGAVVVFCAVGGVEPQSETVWHQADKYHVPKVAFINKMDRVGADFFSAVRMMSERFNSKPLPIQIPWGREENFNGVVDLIRQKLLTWDPSTLGLSYEFSEIPLDVKPQVERYREEMLEMLAELDDTFAEKYLEGSLLSEKDIMETIRKTTLSLKIVPVMCGSALRNKGVQPILDAVVSYLPSPEDVPPMKGINPLTKAEEIRISSNQEPLAALAFKIMQDEGRKMTYLRIYSGQLKTGQEIYNASKGKKEKIARLLKMHANKRERVEQAFAGEIIAVMGLKETATGDTICDEAHPILLEPIEFYEPVISQAIEAKTPADQEKLSLALAKFMEEDPTIKVKYEDETAQTVISGMGELHLEIIIDRLLREFNTHVNVGKPRVVYRETIQKKVDIERFFEKELGEKKHFGHVRLTLEPWERGNGVEFIRQIDGTVIPEEYFGAVEEGIHEAALSGCLSGYPLVDIRVRLIGGSYREGEASVLAYKIAAGSAFKDGCAQAEPIQLEPIMDVDVITPSEFMGDVIGDIHARRGEIQAVTPKGSISEIRARVPLKALFGYSTDLRSATQGRAVFSMQFFRFDKT